MTDITWKEPPEVIRQGRPNVYRAVFDALREHPNRWALIAEGQANGSQVSRLRAVAPDITFRTNLRDDGKTDIYAVYARVAQNDSDTEPQEDDDQW